MDISFLEEVFTYHESDANQVESMRKIRHYAMTLGRVIAEECPACADRSVALRKLREAVMVANAAIVLKGIV